MTRTHIETWYVCLGIFAICFLIQQCATAELVGPVTLRGKLTPSEILPGEPLLLHIECSSTTEEKVFLVVYGNNAFSNSEFNIEIENSTQALSYRRELVAFPSSQSRVVMEEFKPRQVTEVLIPVHMQMTTDLPDASYQLEVVFEEVRIYEGAAGDSKPVSFKDVRISEGLEFKVNSSLPYTLESKYKSLYDAALLEQGDSNRPYYHDNHFLLGPNQKQLLWAFGPTAVPHQISLLLHGDTGYPYEPGVAIHAFDNVAKFADSAQLSRIVDLVTRSDFKCPNMSNPNHDALLVWCLQEAFKRGEPSIVELVRPAVEKCSGTINMKSVEANK